MAATGPTDFLKKNQQHIQQLEQQRQHELKMAEAAVLAESRLRKKLRDKVLSMREEKWSSSPPARNDTAERTFTHSDTMPSCYASPEKAASPPRRCLSASNDMKKVLTLLPCNRIARQDSPQQQRCEISALEPSQAASASAAAVCKAKAQRHSRILPAPQSLCIAAGEAECSSPDRQPQGAGEHGWQAICAAADHQGQHAVAPTSSIRTAPGLSPTPPSCSHSSA